MKTSLLALGLGLFLSSAFIPTVFAWSNGGYSADPSNPDYGTHDWIAQHAESWLPTVERKWIDDNLNLFLYGTEYPDNSGAFYGTTHGYGDTVKHHNYYNTSGFVTDASAANRAKAEYDKALVELKAGRNDTAAIYAGSMTHYIDDLGVFGHVMTNESHHDDYESYVETRTTSYNYGVFESYLVFDGNLENVSAYDASISLGRNTFNDNGGTYTANWMDINYNWNSLTFKNRCGESLDLATNYVADVLHTLVVSAFGTTVTTKSSTTISCSVSSSEVTDGNSITVSGSISPVVSGKTVTLTYKKPDGSAFNRTVSSGSDGKYSDTYSLSGVGAWSVKVSWEGDSTYTGASSSSASFTVKAKSDKVATPTFSPAGGTYSSVQNVALSCATSGATIRFSIDGSEPSSSSTVCSGPISVSSTTTVKAKAFKVGMTDSDTATATYTITTTPSPEPLFGNWLIYALIGVVAIVAIVGGVLYWRKGKK